MIISETVRLRAIERQDLPLFVAWLNDPEVRQHLLVNIPLSQAQEDGWFDRMLARPLEEQPLGIEVRTPEGWRLVGNCSFFDLDWRNRCCEIGIFIGDKEYWGRGYGTEDMQLIVRYGFEQLNLRRISLTVFEYNQRAVRSYQKIGFQEEGRMRQLVNREGRRWDLIYMGLLRADWEALNPRIAR